MQGRLHIDSNLMEVSQFLTTLQDYFRADDEPLERNITVYDIHQALEYQNLLHEFIYHEYKVSIDPKDVAMKRKLSHIQSDLEDTLSEVKLVHRILKRFEVWMTKDLAQIVFMLEGGAPLLNLPSADSVRVEAEIAFPRKRRWNKTRISVSNALLVPPNRWTWPEFFRLAYMVSLLPTEQDRDKAHRSTITATSVMFGRKADEDLKTAEEHEWQPSELIALWVRAQRNTSAWRHLTQLFTIETTTIAPDRRAPVRIAHAEGSGKRLVVDNKSPSEEQVRYSAHFQGNRTKTNKRVRSDGNLMDKVVEWAVTNQMLFTYEHIVEGISNGSIPHVPVEVPPEAYELKPFQAIPDVFDERSNIQKGSSKRPLSENAGSDTATKKQRADLPVEKDRKLLRAKQSYILRWFARRNRRVTSILYSGNPARMLPIYQTLVSDMVEKGVPEEIRAFLQSNYASTDRTFERIDRRILSKGKYDDGESFRIAVLEVLEALKATTTDIAPESIIAAMQDFKELYKRFLEDDRAAELVMSQGSKSEIELLGVLQPPWAVECDSCVSNVIEVCDNCERHSCKGLTMAKKSLQDIVASTQPLAQAFSVRHPKNVTAPDFRSMEGLQWTRVEIAVPVTGALGIAIFHTGVCKRDFHKLVSGKLLASKLEGFKDSCPLAVDQDGILVIKIMDQSVCGSAGIEVGDIITHCRADGENEWNNLNDENQAISELQKIVKRGSTIWFTVQKPNEPIVNISLRWLKELRRKANKVSKRIFAGGGTIQHFCEGCIARETLSKPLGLVEEAKRCLAVIRRLAMESYAIPFHYEDHISREDHENSFSFVSLFRLDQMMQSIIQSKSLTAGGYDWPFSDPPQLVEKGGWTRCNQARRLKWLSDEIMNKPLELLCRGMSILLTPPSALFAWASDEPDPFSTERIALADHFLSLYTSWCIRSCLDIECVGTIGPPPGYSCFTRLWDAPTCKFCMCPFLQNEESGCYADNCPREACRVMLRKTLCGLGRAAPGISENSLGEDIEDVNGTADVSENLHVEEAARVELVSKVGAGESPPSIEDRLRSYNRCASLVGSVLLILPGDSVLDIPAHFIEQDIKSEMTPFIVASYLPSAFIDVKQGSCIRTPEDRQSDYFEGMFHLLPVINSRQIRFLTNLSEMRELPSNSDSKTWATLQILNLPGVVCLSPRQLHKRLSQTKEIVEAISFSVAMFALNPVKKETHLPERRQVRRRFASEFQMNRVRDSSCEADRDIRSGLDSRILLDIMSLANAAADDEEIEHKEREHGVLSIYSALIDSAVSCNSMCTHDLIESLESIQVHGGSDTQNEETDYEEEQQSPAREQTSIYTAQVHEVDIPSFESSSPLQQGVTDTSRNRQAASESLIQAMNASSASQVLVSSVTQAVVRPETTVHDASNREVARTVHQEIPLQVTRRGGTHGTNVINDSSVRELSIPKELSREDLFQAGPEGTYLTRVEASVTTGTLRLGFAQLARRLLCPRYRWSQADEQIRILERVDKHMLPLANHGFLTFVMQHDFHERAVHETGEIIARDDTYEYKLPDLPLSLDTMLVRWLENNRAQVQPHGMPPPPPPRLFEKGETQSQRNPTIVTIGRPNQAAYGPRVHQNKGSTGIGHQRMQFPGYDAIELRRHNLQPANRDLEAANQPGVAARSSSRNLTDSAVISEIQKMLPEHSPVMGSRHAMATAPPPLSIGDKNVPNDFMSPLILDGEQRSIVTTDGKRHDRPVINRENSTIIDLLDYDDEVSNNERIINRNRDNTDSSCCNGDEETQLLASGVTMDIIDTLSESRETRAERIRGGGPEDSKVRRLDSLPPSSWNGRLVWSSIDTKEGEGECSEDKCMGYVINRTIGSANEDGNIEVELIWISSYGLYDDPMLMTLPVTALYLVDDGSEESCMEKLWNEMRPRSLPSTLNSSPLPEAPSDCNGDVADDCGVSGAFVRRLQSSTTGPVYLGALPDGRRVLWISSDPQSVHLRVDRETELLRCARASAASQRFLHVMRKVVEVLAPETQQSLSFKNGSKFCCFWGCTSSTPDGNETPKWFVNDKHLVKHLEDQHKHVAGTGGEFVTLRGPQIVLLALDLITACCMQWPPLHKLKRGKDNIMHPSKLKSRQFDLDRILKATKTKSEGSLTKILEAYPGDRKELAGMVILWSRLARLYDLDGNGKLKIDPKLFLIEFSPTFFDIIREEKMVARAVDSCFDGNVVPEHLAFSQCKLCCADTEETIQRVGCRGVGFGCAMMCSVGRSDSLKTTYQGPSSSIAMAKSLLVYIATNMPQPLRENSGKSSASTKGSPKNALWDDGRFQQWCKIVERSESTRMLAQALVVLVQSIQRTKLPTWWRSFKAGWSKPFTIMFQPTISGLLLQLYVFDAAIAQFLRESSKESQGIDHLPKALKFMSATDRMNTVSQWASDLNIGAFEGSHGDICEQCQDGGELLCCDYCDRVQHGHCCDPEIVDTETLNQWICDSCIKDISEIKASTED